MGATAMSFGDGPVIFLFLCCMALASAVPSSGPGSVDIVTGWDGDVGVEAEQETGQ